MWEGPCACSFRYEGSTEEQPDGITLRNHPAAWRDRTDRGAEGGLPGSEGTRGERPVARRGQEPAREQAPGGVSARAARGPVLTWRPGPTKVVPPPPSQRKAGWGGGRMAKSPQASPGRSLHRRPSVTSPQKAPGRSGPTSASRALPQPPPAPGEAPARARTHGRSRRAAGGQLRSPRRRLCQSVSPG